MLTIDDLCEEPNISQKHGYNDGNASNYSGTNNFHKTNECKLSKSSRIRRAICTLASARDGKLRQLI